MSHAADRVDAFQYQAIHIGMREAEVRLALGAPAHISEPAQSSVLVPTLRGTERRETRRYTYRYPDATQPVDIYLTFADGVVVDKTKVPR